MDYWKQSGLWLWAQTQHSIGDIEFYSAYSHKYSMFLVIHELGHAFDIKHRAPGHHFEGRASDDFIKAEMPIYLNRYANSDYDVNGCSGLLEGFYIASENNNQERFADIFLIVVVDYQIANDKSNVYKRFIFESGIVYWLENENIPESAFKRVK